MIIRSAISQDSEQIQFLMLAFSQYYVDNNVFSPELFPFWEYKNEKETCKEVLQEWFDRQYLLFVAEDNGKLIGYISGTVKEKQHRVKDHEGYIEDWFVLPEWQHKGIGKDLYNSLINEFRKAKCNRIGLCAYAGNTKAIAMYQQMGFWVYTVDMVKDL